MCAELEQLLLDDLVRRFAHEARVIDSGPVAKWGIDRGGIGVDRPIEVFTLFGIEIRIPSEDVLWAIVQLGIYNRRNFANDIGYYKFKVGKRCIVMTPGQTASLRDRLVAIAEAAEKRADAYYAARERDDEG